MVHVDEGETECSCGCPFLCCNLSEGTLAVGTIVCQSLKHTYKRATHLWERTLCPKVPGSDWHALSCIKRECPNCGFHLLPMCEKELDLENNKCFSWRRFEMVSAGKTKKGDLKKIIRLEYKLTTPRFFLAFAKPKIEQFVLHQHTAKWQDEQFRLSIAALKEGEVMFLIDFAENYSFKGQNEIQSQHWYNFQITILVHITYHRNAEWDPSDRTSKKLITEYHYYISDDPKHDSLFVQYCLDLHWKHLVGSGNVPTRHIVWSDGCASQFKSATAWFYVSRCV
jgi:hypothetical protein